MRLNVPFTALIVLALAGATATAVRSEDQAPPDPVPMYPENYTVLFEDEHVRVLDFRLRKGDTEVFHRHPPNVAVFLGEFKIRFQLPDGTTALREARTGEVAYSNKPVIHSPENIGGTDAHGILIELKQHPAALNP